MLRVLLVLIAAAAVTALVLVYGQGESQRWIPVALTWFLAGVFLRRQFAAGLRR